ncbi:MAG: polyprenyl synthetase family protein, partial [Verrucomicrobiota bacterium]
PALHRRLGESGESAQFGRNQALVLGDVLFGAALDQLSHPDAPPSRAMAAMRYFSEMVQETGLGQARELEHAGLPIAEVDLPAIEETYWLKTGRYSFESPLRLAALLSGADRALLDRIEAIARPLGLGFQIENDLHEVRQIAQCDPAEGSQPDFDAGVKTYFLRHTWNAASVSQRVALEAWLRHQADPEAARIATETLCQPHLHQQIEAEIERLFTTARQQITHLPDPLPTRLGTLCDFLSSRRQHSETLAPA